MTATIALPDVTATARRARDIFGAWTADPEMPETAGSLGDAVKVMAIRAAVYAATGDEQAAAVHAPAAVELSAMLLTARFPELHVVAERTGHPFLAGDGGTGAPDGYLHQVYVATFGPVNKRYWPV